MFSVYGIISAESIIITLKIVITSNNIRKLFWVKQYMHSKMHLYYWILTVQHYSSTWHTVNESSPFKDIKIFPSFWRLQTLYLNMWRKYPVMYKETLWITCHVSNSWNWNLLHYSLKLLIKNYFIIIQELSLVQN